MSSIPETDSGLRRLANPEPEWIIPEAVSLTIRETEDGPAVTPYTETDARERVLRIDIFPDANSASLAESQEFVRILAEAASRQYKPVAAVLAADTTHATGDPGFYHGVGLAAEVQHFDLNRVIWLQLDNYWYPERDGAKRTDRYDFRSYLLTKFINPNRIDPSHFIGIRSRGNSPEKTAMAYELLFRAHQPVIGTFGVGPLPEAHLAYLPAGSDLNGGYIHIPISPATINRNLKRGQVTQPTAITMGLGDIGSLRYKFVASYKNPDTVERAFLGPIDNRVVATALRRPEFRTGVRVFLNRTAGQPLLDRLQ